MAEKSSRDRALIRASWVSTIGNGILAVSKVAVGILAGSLAVLSDGIDTVADVVISLVMILAAVIVSKPPTKKYSYGFDKAEMIATKLLSLMIFYGGVQMLVMSIQRLFSDEVIELPAPIAIYVTIFSIVGKLLLAWSQYKHGKKINSSLLMANAVNMRNDVIISVGVLVGLAFTFLLDLPLLDAVTGMLISIFIIWSSVEIFMESSVGLMDGVKDEKVYEKIFEAVEKVPGAHNPHRVRSRQMGDMYMVALDIEAEPDITLREAHGISNDVEKSIRENVENIYDIVVHVEPMGMEHDDEKFGIDKDMV